MSPARKAASERWKCAAHLAGEQPALLRFDKGLLRGQALLALAERQQAEGILIDVGGGVLAHRTISDPRFAAFHEIGIKHVDVSEYQSGGPRS